MATATSWTDAYAIFKAYPNVVRVNQDEGCFDASDNKIDVDQDNVDAARVELNTAATAIKYQTDRTTNGSKTYDTIGNQLDMIYADLVEVGFLAQ